MATTVRRELERYREGRANGTAPPRLLILDEGAHIIAMVHNEFRDLLPLRHCCRTDDARRPNASRYSRNARLHRR